MAAGRDRAAGPAAGAPARARAALGPARGPGAAEAPRDADAAAGRGAARLRRAGAALPGLRQSRHQSTLRHLPRSRARRAAALRRGRGRGSVGDGAGRRSSAAATMCWAARCGRWTGIGPEELGVDRLLRRVEEQAIGEVILALGRHRRRPDHQPLPGRPPAAARLHGHPPGPWRAGRRRAHLSRRGHPGRRPARAPAGRLTVRAQVLTSRQPFTTGHELRPWRCSRSCRPRTRC